MIPAESPGAIQDFGAPTTQAHHYFQPDMVAAVGAAALDNRALRAFLCRAMACKILRPAVGMPSGW
jgi:hypothetical protein